MFGLLFVIGLPAAHAGSCSGHDVSIQILGIAETDPQGRLPSSSYLIWVDGKARVLIDAGIGSAANFQKSAARISDLDVILLSQLHLNYAGDLPALVQASLLERRTRAMPVYGPDRNKLAPSTVTFVRALFDTKRGAYRYLGGLLSPLGRGTYKLQPHAVRIKGRFNPQVYKNERVRVAAAAITTGSMPVLAWRVQVAGKFIVFMSIALRDNGNLEWLSRGVDLLVVERRIAKVTAAPAPVAPLSATAAFANKMGVNKLVVVHLPGSAAARARALGMIAESYAGPTELAGEMDCIVP